MNKFSDLASARRSFLLVLMYLAVLLPLPSVVGTGPANAPALGISFCDAPTVLPNNTGLATYSPELCFGYSGLSQGTYTLKAHLLQWNAAPGSPPCGSNQWCGPSSNPPAIFTIDNTTGTNSAGTIVEVRNMDVFVVPPYTSFMWVIDLYDQNNSIVISATQPASSTTNRAPVLNPIGDRNGNVGVTLQFTLSASDIEGDALGFSVQNLPPGATLNPMTGVFNWPSPVAGAYSSIIFKANQTGAIPLNDAEIISIQINPSNQVLTLSSSAYTTGEGGPAMVTVNRTGGSAGTVTVQYATANITATGSDYTATSGTLTFGDGITTKIISVPIINGTNTESNETFHISLSNPTGGAGLGTSTATVTIVDGDTPSVSGQWGPPIPWQTLPIHMHLLPTGKVLFWDRHDDPSNPQGWDANPWIWDPTTQVFTVLPQHPIYDIFCSGHTFMADGKLIVTGGHHMANDVGENTVSVYDPVENSWTPLPNMNAGRWYPTSTTLANGDILVLAGTMTAFDDINQLPQVWQTASGTWRNLTTATFQGIAPAWPDYYPFMFLAPNGKVFDAGPQQTSRYLDTSGTGAWSNVANSSLIYRDYGSSLTYADGKVLIVGGNPRAPADPNTLPSATVEVIDLNTTTPAWRLISPMSVGRRHLNTTLLPDGQVLVTGGGSFPGHDDPAGKVLYAEMWNPGTEAWTPMAGYTRYRGYHSNALLLPDGRVLMAGGGHPDPPTGAEQNAEIYSPPYLFKGVRPTITSAPAQVAYGQTFFVETSTPQSITKATWIRLSSVTHAFNQNQRINSLIFSQTSGGLLVTAPTSANLCPPGDYMLFILNSNDVPSVARIIRVGPSAGVGTDTAGLYNPAGAGFFLRNSNTGGIADITFSYGPAGMGLIPLVGDWNGDGVDTIGLYNPATAAFFLRNSNTGGIADITFTYGPAGMGFIPLVGDWNGDGVDTIGLYNPAGAAFFLRNSNTGGIADISFTYGPAGMGFLPVVGDWDGNGTDTIGLYNPAGAAFFLRNANTGGIADITFTYGPAGMGLIALVGDWNSDGVDTIGLYNPAGAAFFLRNSNTGGIADITFTYGPAGMAFKPLVGDWDGL